MSLGCKLFRQIYPCRSNEPLLRCGTNQARCVHLLTPNFRHACWFYKYPIASLSASASPRHPTSLIFPFFFSPKSQLAAALLRSVSRSTNLGDSVTSNGQILCCCRHCRQPSARPSPLATFTRSYTSLPGFLIRHLPNMEPSKPVISLHEQSSECVCGNVVDWSWVVTHASGSACDVQTCTSCWQRWTLVNVDKNRESDSVSCICNKEMVSLTTLGSILPAEDFSRYASLIPSD